jgi:hypothetical protein
LNTQQSNQVADAVDNLVATMDRTHVVLKAMLKATAKSVEEARTNLIDTIVANKPDIGRDYVLRYLPSGEWEASWPVPDQTLSTTVQVSTNEGPEAAANYLRNYLEKPKKSCKVSYGVNIPHKCNGDSCATC